MQFLWGNNLPVIWPSCSDVAQGMRKTVRVYMRQDLGGTARREEGGKSLAALQASTQLIVTQIQNV